MRYSARAAICLLLIGAFYGCLVAVTTVQVPRAIAESRRAAILHQAITAFLVAGFLGSFTTCSYYLLQSPGDFPTYVNEEANEDAIGTSMCVAWTFLLVAAFYGCVVAFNRLQGPTRSKSP